MSVAVEHRLAVLCVDDKHFSTCYRGCGPSKQDLVIDSTILEVHIINQVVADGGVLWAYA